MNFFASKTAAERYSRARPYFHPAVIERIKNSLSLYEPLPRAIDVGCGTGLSSRALKAIAKAIVGVDASSEMIALAPEVPGVTYVVAGADQLPFRNTNFDLMTLSQAFHWVDRDVFLEEARRVLRADRWLVVYDNYFIGLMKENPGFEAWFHENYSNRFPAPARARLTFAEDDSENLGFHLLRHDRYSNTWRFSLTGLVEYLVTHSNVIAAVEYGNEDLDEVRRWLTEKIRPFYGEAPEAEFFFDGVIWYLRSPA